MHVTRKGTRVLLLMRYTPVKRLRGGSDGSSACDECNKKQRATDSSEVAQVSYLSEGDIRSLLEETHGMGGASEDELLQQLLDATMDQGTDFS